MAPFRKCLVPATVQRPGARDAARLKLAKVMLAVAENGVSTSAKMADDALALMLANPTDASQFN